MAGKAGKLVIVDATNKKKAEEKLREEKRVRALEEKQKKVAARNDSARKTKEVEAVETQKKSRTTHAHVRAVSAKGATSSAESTSVQPTKKKQIGGSKSSHTVISAAEPLTPPVLTPSQATDTASSQPAKRTKKLMVADEEPEAGAPVSLHKRIAWRSLKPHLGGHMPALRYEHMRAVAYVGMFYIAIGVCTASYALAQMSGLSDVVMGRIMGEDRPQAASTVLSTGDATTSSDSSSNSGTGSTSGGSDSTADSSGSGSTSGDSGDTTSTSDTTTQTTTTSGDGSDATSGTSGTPDATATSNTSSTTTTFDSSIMRPRVEYHFSESSPLSGDVPILIKVRRAERVELRLMQPHALMPLYLGRAMPTTGSTEEWRFLLRTKDIPNGGYVFVARVTNAYGAYDGPLHTFTILNPVASTTANTTYIAPSNTITEAVKTIEAEMDTPAIKEEEEEEVDATDTDTVPGSVSPTTVAQTAPTAQTVGTEEDDKSVASSTLASDEETALHVRTQQLKRFTDLLNVLIERFAVAYRAQDTEMQDRAKDEIEELQKQTLATFKELKLVDGDAEAALERELIDIVAREMARIETRERMIEERVGNAIAQDTDGDGVVDYDELNLFNTDPTSADSDSDGFTDGAEVMSGYDPTNAEREAAIVFVDPKESGPERPELLAVDAIATERAETGEVKGARISGKGLPNSYVTLYIFSTPVVVTVRTGEDGSWSYVFDKELEDGEHTVYVGMTDNAGRIVAKSKPFPFVKTAEAFTGKEVPKTTAAAIATPELVSSQASLLIIALALVLAGLSLVALGAYFMRPKWHEPMHIPASTPA